MSKVHVIEVPFHIGDFLSGTMHMDATEIGAYWMLCVAHYQAGEIGLPDDDIKLARIAKVTPKTWAKIRATLAEKFDIANGFWTSKRVVEILLEILDRSEVAKANALKRWNPPDAKAKRKQSRRNANQKPLNNNSEEPKNFIFEGKVIRLLASKWGELRTKHNLTDQELSRFMDNRDEFVSKLPETDPRRMDWFWPTMKDLEAKAEGIRMSRQ